VQLIGKKEVPNVLEYRPFSGGRTRCDSSGVDPMQDTAETQLLSFNAF
jgi:hypothetical protein